MNAIRVLGITLLALVFNSACIPLHQTSGTAIKPDRVAQIEPGKTLKRDALEWFGAPMTLSDRGEITVIPEPTRLDKLYHGPRTPGRVESNTFYELFSDKHEFHDYHRIYYFYYAESKHVIYYLLVFYYMDFDTRFDKLWLLVNEKTGVVEDFYFRKAYVNFPNPHQDDPPMPESPL